MIRWLIAATGMWVLATTGRGQSEPDPDPVRERLREIGLRSVSSATGHLVVSGPDSLANAAILSLADETLLRVEDLTGLTLSFDAQSVRIMVMPADAPPLPHKVVLEQMSGSGLRIYRVLLADYPAMETADAAEALVAALLLVYRDQTGGTAPLPAWLPRGMVRVLTPHGRQDTLDTALQRWQEGKLASPLRIVAGAADDDPVSCGALVAWLTDLPDRTTHVRSLFDRLSGADPLNADWLQSRMGAGIDMDEQWDRWLLARRTRVHRLGEVRMEHLDALYAAWFIAAGRDGIPFSVNVPVGADASRLVAFRRRPWLIPALRRKRLALEMQAAGRPVVFQDLVGAYVKVLDAIEQGAPPAEVHALHAVARRQWQRLREQVRASGGVLADF